MSEMTRSQAHAAGLATSTVYGAQVPINRDHLYTLVARNTDTGCTYTESSAGLPEPLHIPTQTPYTCIIFVLLYTPTCASVYTITVVTGQSSQVGLADIFRAPEVLFWLAGLLGREGAAQDHAAHKKIISE